MRSLFLAAACALSLCAGAAGRDLEFWFVDVEGGQATLIVSPSGESMLVDTGWPGRNGRDADRIQKAAKAAGVKKIDYLLTTHYHLDHVGGVQQLLERIPVKTFVDHGPNNETDKGAKELTAMYEKALATGKRLVVKAGDRIPLKGLEVEVVTANGERNPKSSGRAGSNPHCRGTRDYPTDPSENARSIGFLLSWGKFQFVNLADLTAKKELELACPENQIGPVDLYLTTHHGLDQSNSQEIVHGMQPRVAVMNNGARKGGSPAAWTIVRNSPGLEDLWQLHFSVAGGKDHNSPEPLIANLSEACDGKAIHVVVKKDGSFTVTNERNNYSKTYAAK